MVAVELCKGQATADLRAAALRVAALRAAALRAGRLMPHRTPQSRLCVFCLRSADTSRVFLSAALDVT